MKTMRYAYPILLDLADRPVLLVGGGKVAVRKAVGLIRAGASDLRCVAPRIDTEMPARVRQIHAPFAPAHLQGVSLVIAATDSPPVNDQVVQEARARGIWVSRADGQEVPAGDFVTPAWHAEGALLVAVSGGGAALSAYLRDQIRQRMDPRWGRLAEAMREIRPRVRRNRRLAPSQRREIFRAIASEAALDVVAEGGIQGVLDWLSERWVELADAD